MNFIGNNQLGAVLLLSVLAVSKLHASELVVIVEGELDRGIIGCALFDRPEAFPTGVGRYQQQFLVEDLKQVECKFKDLTPGRYAVAVMHDLNGNSILDKNFLGIPKEPWGVSNNVRPNLREPEFVESSFEMTSSEQHQITIRIAK